jgi:WD40 repeat protein
VTNDGDWTLDQILKEKHLYDQNLNFEKNSGANHSGWTEPSPEKPSKPEGVGDANGLAVVGDSKTGTLVASFVNNTVGFWDTAKPPRMGAVGLATTSRNVLSLAVRGSFLLASYMDGSVSIHDIKTFQTLSTVKAHLNYAVHVVTTEDQGNLVVATAGWDRRVSIHCPSAVIPGTGRRVDSSDSQAILFSTTFTTHTAAHNVQSLIFARHPDNGDLYLVYTVRDSIYLHYLLLTPSKADDGTTTYSATQMGRQSLAPQQHSSWTAFTPAHIEACPTDPTLVAVATSHTPSMKLTITRLLFPGLPEPQEAVAPLASSTVLPHLGTQDELAIRLAVNTNAPQNDYSTPRCAWRPDGSGVWVSGDDGVIRGVDATTGKVVRELRKGGHDQGSKVRCLWAGLVGEQDGDGEREVLISGGFDKKVLVWEVA